MVEVGKEMGSVLFGRLRLLIMEIRRERRAKQGVRDRGSEAVGGLEQLGVT
jgi:hypothetical protein